MLSFNHNFIALYVPLDFLLRTVKRIILIRIPSVWSTICRNISVLIMKHIVAWLEKSGRIEMEVEIGVLGEISDDVEEELAFFGFDDELPSEALGGALVERGHGGRNGEEWAVDLIEILT